MSGTAGAIDALEKKLTETLSRAEARLVEEARTTAENTTEIVPHLRAAGGKRMRPLPVSLISRLGSTEGDAPVSEDLTAAGVAAELTHLASLYHDDLADDATVRRGVAAAYVRRNNTSAVMAGDLIFAYASLIASDSDRELMKYHARTFQRLCLSRMHNVLGPGAADDPIDFYLHVLCEKTGSFIGTTALYGAALSGYSPEICTAVTVFGEDLRVAFQIADDMLDLRSTTAISEKMPGTDLHDGTKTLPMLLLGKSVAAGDTSDADRHLMKMIGSHETLSADAALSGVVDRFVEHRVTREAATLTETWMERALGYLTVLPEGAVKTAFTKFSRQQIDRLHQLSACHSAVKYTGDYDHPHPASTTEGATVNAHTVVNCVGTLDDSVKIKVGSSMYTTSGRVGKTSAREGYEGVEGYGDLACIWNIETCYVVADAEIWCPAPLWEAL